MIWASVTAVGPLRIQLDGDTAALPVTPDSLIDPASLVVTNRVRVEITQNRVVVVGRAGGTVIVPPSNLNVVRNSRFRLNQRGYVSAASLASGVFGLDGWRSMAAGTTVTFTVDVHGQPVTVNASHSIAQNLERADVVAGSWTFSAVETGTATARIYNKGATPPSYQTGPFTVTLDGTADVVVELSGGASGGSFDQVKLEPGTVATSYQAETVADELRACQRYYWRVTATATGNTVISSAGAQASTTTGHAIINLFTPLRAAPVVTFSTLAYSDLISAATAVSALALAGAGYAPGSSDVWLTVTYGAYGAQYRPGWLNTNGIGGYVALDAELT